ncbi:UDP-4-amino-4,6-dideoxy-N-acetyl-beta-L-altrosamine transaminase [Sulfurimonas sp.]|jgi:UDP-4-amino-4,6-dideoxy-L-N-acetyl-beta-L-altrosamine transaminase|uniref:UDP-4-amino-4, 6-dideoxy-N-acetyl-beta-L-altrosamine transaminase n=1 Tax=Sulfurimonas sp. TaxID=2022749 RepID=UPI0025FAEBC7|nr:UDP-4-amino-4,6-dideoxy-N-acetyl-beta-L-altrosamine transaminase [Sulfurimonas sp.]MBT5935839.1 UDP-4-amino-4,6-dideoxy-N-acetyl-beta-L-altrosamine transaminase [Sulfurimonas sp.]
MSNLSYSTQLIEEDDIAAVVKVLEGNFLAQGPKVAEFEQSLCDYTGAMYAVCFNSATSALAGAYSVSGITKGDEVITTPISFVTTSNMFVDLDAVPVWCDVTLNGNIDAEKIESLITPKTKAIVPVHFSGNPVELQKIHLLARKHNLLVIEDAAHALGSSINGKKIGSLSDMTLLSFHAIKPITTSEGGAILTDNKEYATKLRLFRSHGIVKKELWNSDMISMGYNYRLTEVAAALGISQLKKLDKFINIRNEIAAYYDKRFKDQNSFLTFEVKQTHRSARHLYPIILNSKLRSKKEAIFQELQKRELGVQVHYKPIYQNSFYIEKFGKTFLPVAEEFYKGEISIPCHHNMTLNDAVYVADTLLEVLV